LEQKKLEGKEKHKSEEQKTKKTRAIHHATKSSELDLANKFFMGRFLQL
jgi:hypothetical protein